MYATTFLSKGFSYSIMEATIIKDNPRWIKFTLNNVLLLVLAGDCFVKGYTQLREGPWNAHWTIEK